MFTASIWWRNCDTLSTVIGKDRQTVLNQIVSLRDDELDRAIDDEICGMDKPESANEEEIKANLMSDLCWTGILEHDNLETFELDPEQTAALERDGIIII